MAIVGFVVLKVTNTRTGRFFGRGPPAFAEGKLSPDFSPTDGLVLRLPQGSHRPPCSAERSGYPQQPSFRAGTETRPYGTRRFSS